MNIEIGDVVQVITNSLPNDLLKARVISIGKKTICVILGDYSGFGAYGLAGQICFVPNNKVFQQ